MAMKCLVAVFILIAAVICAQEPGGIVLRSDTRLVEVDVTVRDSKGKPVKDLQQRDFTILDNGKPLPFTVFSVNRGEPVTVAPEPLAAPARPGAPKVFSNAGRPRPSSPDPHATIILLDGMNGWFESFVWGSRGVQGLMDKLPADERIAVYVLAKDEGLLQVADYTTDRERIKQTLKTFRPIRMPPSPPGMGPGPDGAGLREDAEELISSRKSAYIEGSVREKDYSLRKATEGIRLSFRTLAERLRTVPGRKSVFWVTEGFPPRVLRGSRDWDRTVAALNDANVAVNTVDADGLGGPSRRWGAGGILTMQRIAGQTGGQAFFHRNDLDAALAEGVANSRSSYTLGFYLGDLDGKYHGLTVRVSRPGLVLDHRRGYYSQTDAMHDLANRTTELESAILNPLDLTGVNITARAEVTAGTLAVHLRLGPEGLTLAQDAGVWNGRVDELFLERSEAGGELARVKQTAKFDFDSAGKADYDSRGAVLTHSVRYVPGATKLFIVIRDSASGRTGSLTIALQPM